MSLEQIFIGGQMKKYKIQYVNELKKWVVFEIKSPNLLWQVYGAKLKRDCKKWVEKHQ